MLGTLALDEMGEEDLLAYAAAARRHHPGSRGRPAPDRLPVGDHPPPRPARPGRRRPARPGASSRLGGDGTPEVMRVRGRRAGRPDRALAVRRGAADGRRPRPQAPAHAHWARVEAGEVRASYARYVCAKTRNLTKEEAAYVDAEVAESADGRIPWSRFEALVEGKVAASRTRGRPRERGDRPRKATFAKKLRTEAYGMATFMVRADVATIDAIEAAVTAKADQLEATMPDAGVDAPPGPRRAAAGPPRRHPETPIADLLPTVQLYLHSYVGPDAEPASPASRATARSPKPGSPASSAPHAKFKIQPGPRPRRTGTRRRLRDPPPT